MAWDAIIIGAGPAGLTAAAYLGRFRRAVLVLHGRQSRARWIPTSHNTPGFPSGVSGPDLLSRLECQARLYGATVVPAEVSRLETRDDGILVSTGDQAYEAPFVILATGVIDKLPPIDGISEAVHRGVMRLCPICDAYEAIDQSIAVLGDGPHGIREAEFLRSYSDRVSLIHVGTGLQEPELARLAEKGIAVFAQPMSDLVIEERGVTLRTDGKAMPFDVCYAALGCTPQTSLLTDLNVKRDESGMLVVNAHQETSVSGIYAAGDVVRGLSQIIVAGAEGAVAATDIHNKLRAHF